MRQSVLNRSLVVSLLVHAGLLGLLLLVARPPVSLDKPLRVRILEPPAEVLPAPSGPDLGSRPLPRPVPRVAPVPPARRGSSERETRGERIGRPEGSGVSPVLPQGQTPEVPAPSPPPPQAAPGPIPEAVPPPLIASRPSPEPVPPPAEPRREFREEGSPNRSGLSLGGPLREVSRSPAPTGPPAGTRPSIMDQINKLGSGLTADAGGSAKKTIPLDSREPRFLDYLGRLKQRIQNEWIYPEEARQVGMGGELVLVFTLNRAGTLTYIRLVESSGFPILDTEALRAVKAVAPFDPFPPQMGDEPLNISAIFRYHALYYHRRN